MTGSPASASGSFEIGGEIAVNRLGFGTLQLTGPGYWGDPEDPDEAVAVLRRAVELGVNLIDTADAYGPNVAEEFIRKALYPYPDGLLIATKAGQVRPGPSEFVPVGNPEYLRQQVELSLRRLGLERIGLFQLHRLDPRLPLAEQVGVLAALQQEGKIGHVGLSEITVEELVEAREIVEIAAVQNLFNLAQRDAEPLLDYTTENGIAFIPWWPLATGELASEGSPLQEISVELDASPSQLALAWLLRRSPAMLPIPGTSKVAHLEDNLGAAAIELSDEQFEALDASVDLTPEELAKLNELAGK